eukprot:TRINITY_DN6561_c0_g1_i1.p1 TRINITY_DN6561_c0_g1~~TRINITY_DN6561_c0_g1_i1.p1  ORF type:complete len:639 (+),score=151.33 TRINITY_DN6561_c0_g1_i1:110-2026(+)
MAEDEMPSEASEVRDGGESGCREAATTDAEAGDDDKEDAELEDYLDDRFKWTIFEDAEDEISYLRRRGDVLLRGVLKERQEVAKLHEAGVCIQEAYEGLQQEYRQAVGDAAYWQAMAEARQEEIEALKSSVEAASRDHDRNAGKENVEPALSQNESCKDSADKADAVDVIMKTPPRTRQEPLDDATADDAATGERDAAYHEDSSLQSPTATRQRAGSSEAPSSPSPAALEKASTPGAPEENLKERMERERRELREALREAAREAAQAEAARSRDVARRRADTAPAASESSSCCGGDCMPMLSVGSAGSESQVGVRRFVPSSREHLARTPPPARSPALGTPPRYAAPASPGTSVGSVNGARRALFSAAGLSPSSRKFGAGSRRPGLGVPSRRASTSGGAGAAVPTKGASAFGGSSSSSSSARMTGTEARRMSHTGSPAPSASAFTAAVSAVSSRASSPSRAGLSIYSAASSASSRAGSPLRGATSTGRASTAFSSAASSPRGSAVGSLAESLCGPPDVQLSRPHLPASSPASAGKEAARESSLGAPKQPATWEASTGLPISSRELASQEQPAPAREEALAKPAVVVKDPPVRKDFLARCMAAAEGLPAKAAASPNRSVLGSLNTLRDGPGSPNRTVLAR